MARFSRELARLVIRAQGFSDTNIAGQVAFVVGTLEIGPFYNYVGIALNGFRCKRLHTIYTPSPSARLLHIYSGPGNNNRDWMLMYTPRKISAVSHTRPVNLVHPVP